MSDLIRWFRYYVLREQFAVISRNDITGQTITYGSLTRSEAEYLRACIPMWQGKRRVVRQPYRAEPPHEAP